MTRLEKLEAVAEAARSALHDAPGAHERLSAALAAIDADAGAETGETVTLELWAHKDGDVVPLLPGSFISRDWETNQFRRRLGTVTLPLAKERGA